MTTDPVADFDRRMQALKAAAPSLPMKLVWERTATGVVRCCALGGFGRLQLQEVGPVWRLRVHTITDTELDGIEYEGPAEELDALFSAAVAHLIEGTPP